MIALCRSKNRIYNRIEQQDLIYSIGLADYIPDIYLGDLINYSFNLLNSGGKLIIAHKDLLTYKTVTSDWVCDWNFLPRGEGELANLVNSSLRGEEFLLNFEKVKEGRIVFLIVTKLK